MSMPGVANSIFLTVLVLLLSFGCATPVDLRSPAKGSPENPVRCDGPEGERIYLRQLRDDSGKKIKYKYLDSVMGGEGKILDRFELENPAFANQQRGIFESFLGLFRTDPDKPSTYRIYMDMYNPGYFDKEPVRGFQLKPFAKSR